MISPQPGRVWTADEVMNLPDDGNRYELSRGELICMAPSVYWPSYVSGRVTVRLGAFIEQHSLGQFGTAEGGFRLASDPDTLRAPDFWFLRADRVPTGEAGRKFYSGAPDLAVEVLSPSDRFVDVMRKVRDYLEAGTRLVWVIDPDGRSAALFPAEGAPRLIGEDGVLDGMDVLPGFSLPLRDVLP